MASVTYGKCNLWQKYYVKCNYGKNIMANETEPFCSIYFFSVLKFGKLQEKKMFRIFNFKICNISQIFVKLLKFKNPQKTNQQIAQGRIQGGARRNGLPLDL